MNTRKMFLAGVGLLSVLIAPAGAQSLLNEQFSDARLSPGQWVSYVPFYDSWMGLSSGILTLQNGAGIGSVGLYSGALDVTFSLAFTGSTYDSFRVYTRAAEFNTGGYGAKGVGVSLRIQDDGGGLTGNVMLEDNGAMLDRATVSIARYAYYMVRLVDTGSALRLYWGTNPTPLLSVRTGSRYGSRLALFNRAGAGQGSAISAGSTTSIDYITISSLSAPVVSSVTAPRQVVNSGESVTLSVTTTGGESPSYQWRRNGFPVTGATAATYTVSNASPGRDTGWYQAMVSDSMGNTASAPVFVNVAIGGAQFVGWGSGYVAPPASLVEITAVAAGGGHMLALKRDGTVVGWGSNGDGQATPPTGLSNVVALSAGSLHSVALKADGTVVAWGANRDGQCSLPPGLTNVVRVFTAERSNIAVRADGTFEAWGAARELPPITSGMVAVVPVQEQQHTAALKTDNTLVVGGPEVLGLTNISGDIRTPIALVGGSQSFAVLNSDGSVGVWGANPYGQLDVPGSVANAVSLVAGGRHYAVMKSDGTVVAWGDNSSGQTTVPAGLNNVAAIAAGSSFTVAVRNAASELRPTITTQPTAQTVRLGQTARFSVVASAGAPALTYQWRMNGTNLAGATSSTLVIAAVAVASGGSYDVVISNQYGTVTSAAALLTVDPVPFISTQPVAVTVTAGQEARLTVAAVGIPAPNYQWQRNGVSIAGATNAVLTLSAARVADAGSYTCVIANAAGTVTSNAVAVTVNAANPSRLVNVSILTSLETAGDSFTIGYVIGGNGTSGGKQLLVRAAGPSLGALGVAGALDDPKIELFAGAVKTDENDNWGGTAALAAAMTRVGAFSYMSPASRDAAAAVNATTRDNTVKISAVGAGTGTVIAEIYDATETENFALNTPRLVNLSVLKSLGTGFTVGFVVGGSGSRTVLIRAIGPTLATAFGVAGAAADPQVKLFSGQVQVAGNDNWSGAAELTTAFNAVGAFVLPAASRDAALVATLQPGGYTAQVSGVGGAAGTVLVEVYEIP